MKKYDKVLLIAVIIISLFGALMIYSSSYIWAEYKFNDAFKYLKHQSIFLIIGTSLNVYPAAGLLNYVPADVPVYLIDPNEVPIASGRKVHVIQKGASEGMKELMQLLVE